MSLIIRITLSDAQALQLAGLIQDRQAKAQGVGISTVVTPTMVIGALIEDAVRREGVLIPETLPFPSIVPPTPPLKDDPLTRSIRETRLKLGMTQEHWGKLFGLSQSVVAIIESGRRSVPRRIRVAVQQWVRTGVEPPKDSTLPGPRRGFNRGRSTTRA